MRRLGVAHPLLNFFNFILDMPVSDQNVGPAAIVVVEEEATETECDQSRASDFRPRSFVYEQPAAFVVVARRHLVGKVGDDDAGTSGAVVLPVLYPHAPATHAVC